MLIPIVTSNAIDDREPMVFMVEEAQKIHLLDAAKLLSVVLTGSSDVDCTESMFY